MTVLMMIVTGTVCVVLGAATLRLLQLHRIQGERIRALQEQLQALCAGATGTDERILQFEQMLSKLRERQHVLDIGLGGQQGYDHAIRLARKGAGVSQLIDSCNLSDEEAHLISRLHGGQTREAGQRDMH